MPSACVWVVSCVCDVIFLLFILSSSLVATAYGLCDLLLVVWFVCGGWCVRYLGRMVDALAC